jgi:hypothetical protein
VATNQGGKAMPEMKFPPGYGYPSYADWKTKDELNLFDRGLIFVFQVIACSAVVYSTGLIIWVIGMGILHPI